MGGGGEPQIIQPAAPPAPPSATAQLSEYIQNYPKLVELQRQYGPETAGLDYQLFQQYAPQYTQTAQDIQNQVYPQTSKLQESLATQALEGMNSQVPDAFRQQFESDFNAGLGMNTNAPLGVSERNIGLANLQKQWQDYYRNLGLSLANRQPLQQTANPSFQNAGSSENVNPFLNYGASTYGTQMAGYGAQTAGTQYYRNSSPWGMAGGIAGGIGGAMLGGPMGAIAGYGIGSSLGGL